MELDDVTPLLGAAAASTLDEVAAVDHAAPLVLRVREPVDPEQAAEAAAVLRRLPTVGVVIGHPDEVPPALAAAADVCLSTVTDPPRPWVHGPAGPLSAAVEAQPLAAVALASLLRVARHLPVVDAVAAESATYGMLLGSAPFRRWLDRRGPAAPKPHARPPVAVGREGAILTVELDRPDARNAVDREVRDALVEAAALAAADPTITTVTLSGRGTCFSAGGDLDEFGSVPDGATAFAVRLARHPGLAVHAVAGRTTAYLHGPCVGAGVEVPAFAGRVAADPSATFRLPELSMGLVPGAGGTASLARRIGRHRTAWLALTGVALDAATALRWGLVDELRPRDRWPGTERPGADRPGAEP